MVKEDKKITIQQPYIYGYFSKNDVYKIYQPRNKKFKFIKVKPQLQGLDQLEYNQPYLIIFYLILYSIASVLYYLILPRI